MIIRNLISVKVLGVTAALLVTPEFAVAEWESGRCTTPNLGPAPCIEHQDSGGDWWHFNGDGDHAGIWHGYPTNEDGQPPEQGFQFTGLAVLSCGLSSYECLLTLNTELKKFEDDNGNWRIGIRVNSGSVVAGEPECQSISLDNFPWYVGHDPDHNSSFPGEHVLNESTGIVYVGTTSFYTAHIGQLGIMYGFIPLVNAGHMHDVEYQNLGSSLKFGLDGSGSRDNVIYEGSFPFTNSGCTVDGTLNLQLPALNMNIL